MWWRILFRSFSQRKARLALGILSVVLGTSLVAALISLSLDVPSRAGAQLRAYGANLLVLPQVAPGVNQSYILERDIPVLEGGEFVSSIVSYAPYLYSQVEVAGQPLVLVGTWLERVPKLSPWWQVTGSWPDAQGSVAEALVGAQVAEKLRLELGREFLVQSGSKVRSLRVSGIVNTGAAEESQIFVSLEVAQELTGLEGKVGLIQVSALSQSHPLTHLAAFIEQGIPGSEVRILGQIAKAESQVLAKVQLLMALVAALILIVSGLVILSTMTTTLLERTTEIGLMKALGASGRRIIGLFASEIGIIALGGGVIGYFLGYLLGYFVAQRVFAAAISLRPLVLLLTLATACLVTFLGSVLPLRRAVQIDPIKTLKGE